MLFYEEVWNTMTPGKRIRNLRIALGLSQEELAELSGVSRQAVSRWENGSSYPKIEKLILLSRIYAVSLDYLMCIDVVKEDDFFYR